MIVRTIQYALGVERIQSLNNFVYYKRYSMHTVVKKKKHVILELVPLRYKYFFCYHIQNANQNIL